MFLNQPLTRQEKKPVTELLAEDGADSGFMALMAATGGGR